MVASSKTVLRIAPDSASRPDKSSLNDQTSIFSISYTRLSTLAGHWNPLNTRSFNGFRRLRTNRPVELSANSLCFSGLGTPAKTIGDGVGPSGEKFPLTHSRPASRLQRRESRIHSFCVMPFALYSFKGIPGVAAIARPILESAGRLPRPRLGHSFISSLTREPLQMSYSSRFLTNQGTITFLNIIASGLILTCLPKCPPWGLIHASLGTSP